jgi:undecaprenyl-diphosphatase
MISRLPARYVEPMRTLIAFARSEALALGALLVIAGGALAFIDLGEDLREGEQQTFDEAVLHWLHPGPNFKDAIGPAWLDHAMLDLTSLGSLAVLGLVALMVTGYLLLQKQRLEALSLIVGLAGGLLLSETMKQVFERTRPPEIYRAAEALNASFPSGHALLSTVFYLTMAAMLARALKRRRLKAYVIGVGISLALMVGITRVYLGVHWASDVLAGWCLGAAWATACWLAETLLLRRWGKAAGDEEAPS